jgi:hypothetical protein
MCCGFSWRKLIHHRPVFKSCCPLKMAFFCGVVNCDPVNPENDIVSFITKFSYWKQRMVCHTRKNMCHRCCLTQFGYVQKYCTVCVESMVSPFGKRALKGLWDFTLFWQGALINKKCTVQPESTIDVSWCSRSGGGVLQSSNFSLLFKDVAPTHHSLLAWLTPMLSVLVASRLCPFLG